MQKLTPVLEKLPLYDDANGADTVGRPRLFHWNPDTAVREARIRAKATDVFKPAFIENWLQTPLSLYEERTPLEMTQSENPRDFERVMDDLIRLEEGVFL